MPRKTPPRDDEASVPLGWIRGHTKVGPVREGKVTYQLEQYGIEVRVKSLKNDGSLSWTVISAGTGMWKNLTKKKENLSHTKRWQLVPAWRKPPSRQDTRDTQVHNQILSPRCSYQLTNGSGMTFLPSITLKKHPCHGESRRP